jgi:hypothetical protein
VNDSVDGIRAEAKKTKETAERLANGNFPDEADHVRVLAGLIHQLAEQVERLSSREVSSGADEPREAPAAGAEQQLEEDLSPEKAPAQPVDDRAS